MEMDMYYEVLGLKQGAAQAEIKKAYFSLVRKYSPEKDPEKFREIREAYERLKSMDEDQAPVFTQPKDPWAKKFLDQIQIYQKNGEYELFRDACEEARKAFPDEIQFLYLQAKAQRMAGNTGKAVKSGEELVKKEADNKWFWRELAVSYQERGYTRKAFFAYDRAYELGCRDNDSVLEFSILCNDYGRFDKGTEILKEFINRKKRWQKEEIPQVFEAFTGLAILSEKSTEDAGDLLGCLKGFLEKYTIYLAENKDILVEVIALFAACFKNSEVKYRRKILEFVDIFEEACHSEEEREMAARLREACTEGWVYEDPRLSEAMKSGIEAFFIMGDLKSDIKTFAELDMKLCMIEEREEVLVQLDIIEDEYPLYFDKIRDFARQLRDGKNLEYLKSSMLKQYCRLAQYVGGGMYFEKYPKEKERQMGKVIYQNDYDTPYVRSEKKIGRNDPCPCGSGKKYKHCCMRKNAG